jgi:hypothetical protein
LRVFFRTPPDDLDFNQIETEHHMTPTDLQNYLHFADQRMLVGLPQAMDTLSNLPFAIAGLVGLFTLKGRAPSLEKRFGLLFFLGLIATGIFCCHLDCLTRHKSSIQPRQRKIPRTVVPRCCLCCRQGI